VALDGDIHLHCYRKSDPPGMACTTKEFECGDDKMGSLHDCSMF